MSIRRFLKSELAAMLFWALLLGGSSAIAWSLTGWFGIGTIGLLGLAISVSIALGGGPANADGGLGSGDIHSYARQLREAQLSQSSPEQKMAAAAERARRARTLNLANWVFIAMAVLGFWMFVRHQLKLF